MIGETVKKYSNELYALFSLLVGFMFFQHGTGKLFGWFGGSAFEFASLMGVAGIVEVVVGLALFLGLFSRLAALLGAVQMLVAYVKAHLLIGGFNPLTNGGELALLFFAAFLIVLIHGNHNWSLEKKLVGKEQF